jgi:DNA-directed RNA polymerase specialized sigma24 family protein
MSPLSIRRYRAERLLRDEFEALRGRVLKTVRGRLRTSGACLDEGDLEGCYAQAWQGLYAAVLEGREIENPAGWLALVTYRRAVEEMRTQGRVYGGGVCAGERDLASEMDDRMRLRHLFEGLRRRLDGREREAAMLCYLQGFSRAEAATRMGVSDARMRKLMEGRGPERPGVAGKVGALVQTIREGQWCEEQGSLMRAFAYGILDNDGERYRLAIMHSDQCPACRAYVASLRGLAVVLPPVFLPGGLGAAILAGAAEGVRVGGAGVAGATSGAGLQTGGATGVGGVGGIGGAAAASGAGAGGAAGGSWLIGAGSLGGKLAVGCLLALGVGCVAIDGGSGASARDHARHRVPHTVGVAGKVASTNDEDGLTASAADAGVSARAQAGQGGASSPLTPSTRAVREFGPEQTSAAVGRVSARRAPAARAASSGSGGTTASSSRASGIPDVSASSSAPAAVAAAAGDSTAAEREFSPG